MDYIEVTLVLDPVNPWRDIFIAELDGLGFESFVETKTGFSTYIKEDEYHQDLLKVLERDEVEVSVEIKKIEDQNWNQQWEDQFQPVEVEDFLLIRAPFHADLDLPKKQLEIIIQPQMSFGTGHHQTTWLISRRMFQLNLKDQNVLDMGTGTGVLAILAEKLGAKSVFAPDIDEWSFNNAQENSALNHCSRIEVAHGGIETVVGKKFDAIIANINKNILIEQFSVYSKSLLNQGKLIISGFFETDQDHLVQEAKKHGFVFENIFVKDEWAMIEFARHMS